MEEIITLKKPLVLASKSPRRKKLLTQMGLQFDIIPSTIDEGEYTGGGTASEYAKTLAEMKARDSAKRTAVPSVVVGADTIVVIGDKILNKPKDEEDAKRMLEELSGKTHTVYTGICIVDSSSHKELSDVKATKVTFRELTTKEIDAYVAGGSPLDKAGAYGIQDDFGAVFISHIVGCYYNIVGLPLEMFYNMLKEFEQTNG